MKGPKRNQHQLAHGEGGGRGVQTSDPTSSPAAEYMHINIVLFVWYTMVRFWCCVVAKTNTECAGKTKSRKVENKSKYEAH